MSAPAGSRDFDIVVFGATGFTGALTAAYLARNAPADLRWALAGRNQEKLEKVRADLARDHPAAADLALLHADSTDDASLREVAESTRTIITTVGPYLLYGEPLVAACAALGTDYVDITGEPEFVDRMYLEHHDTAGENGARIVHACGFDSVPHDLGAWFTVQHFDGQHPIRLRGVVRSNLTVSGGTLHSALTAMSRPRQMRSAMAARRRKEGRPQGRSSRAVAGRPHRDQDLGYWLLPMPSIDPLVVARSGVALASYGPDFRYTHYLGTRKLQNAVGLGAGASMLALSAQVPPVRELLKKRLPPGQGPSQQRRDRTWFTVDFIGDSDGREVHTRVSGGDPAYNDTAKMLAESALCLTFDENPETSGQVTTATAMAENLTERLKRAKIGFERVNC